jgi:uncharacterized membrane protein
MNSKGQTMFIAIIVACMIFFAGVIVVNFFKDDITTARVAMDCSNPAISDGSKVTCLGIDIVVPYFILIFLSAAGGLIAARLLL